MRKDGPVTDAPRIDLHIHSSASDGTDTPAELVRKAAAVGLSVIALTDHDTTGGWEEALAARPRELTILRGAEFSTLLRIDGHSVSVHLLGYLFEPENPAVLAEHERLREERLGRGLAIIDRLVADRVPISREHVLEIAGTAPVGRPHIGRALVEAQVVESVSAAFATYLAGNSKYYVPKADTPIDIALDMITAAGGVAVVAHGRSRSAARALTRERFAELADLGLRGIEVDHPDHSPGDRAELSEIAAGLGLLTTGSSDYHGTNKTIRLGQETTSPDQLQRLVAEASSTVRPVGPIGAVA
jgi:predicted metal-dependent phosphoesterase TrpH